MTPNGRVLLLTLLLTSCSWASPAPARDADTPMDAGKAASMVADEATGLMPAAAPPSPGAGQAGLPNVAADPVALPAMIIRNGQARIEIDSLEVAMARVRALAGQVGGYIANSQLQAGENQVRSATLEIRVPAGRFEDLVSGLSPIGKVEYVDVTAQDVGEEFTDITARVANARRLEQRLVELLATRTGKLSDVLEIERELARVREEIERMEGRLRYLKAHVATSTLVVTIHERAPVVGETGSGSVLGEAFRDAWRNFVNFVARFISSLGVLIPAGALLLGAGLGLRWLWRRRHGD